MSQGYVYFLINERLNIIKIGWAKYDVQTRIRNHKQSYLYINEFKGIPKDLKLLFYTYGSKNLEARIHKKFEKYRKSQNSREWFNINREIIEYMKSLNPKLRDYYEVEINANKESKKISEDQITRLKRQKIILERELKDLDLRVKKYNKKELEILEEKITKGENYLKNLEDRISYQKQIIKKNALKIKEQRETLDFYIYR